MVFRLGLYGDDRILHTHVCFEVLRRTEGNERQANRPYACRAVRAEVVINCLNAIDDVSDEVVGNFFIRFAQGCAIVMPMPWLACVFVCVVFGI